MLTQQEAKHAQLKKQQAAFAEQEKQLADSATARDAAISETDMARTSLHTSWEHRFAVRALVPLTPEQLAGNTISALELKPRFSNRSGERVASQQQRQETRRNRRGKKDCRD